VNLRAVVFDLFGTLVFLGQNRKPWPQLLRDIGYSDFGRARREVMSHDHETVLALLRQGGLKEQSRLEAARQTIAEDIATAGLYPGVLATLRALRERGIAVGILSNVSVYYRPAFFSLGLDQAVDAWLMSCDEGCVKPDEQIYRLMLERLGVSPQEALMIGDSFRCDVDGPRRIGMQARRIDHRSPSRPEGVLGSLKEVLWLIESLGHDRLT